MSKKGSGSKNRPSRSQMAIVHYSARIADPNFNEEDDKPPTPGQIKYQKRVEREYGLHTEYHVPFRATASVTIEHMPGADTPEAEQRVPLLLKFSDGGEERLVTRLRGLDRILEMIKKINAAVKAPPPAIYQPRESIDKTPNNPYTDEVDIKKEIAKFVSSVGVPMDARADFSRAISNLLATVKNTVEAKQKPLPRKARITYANRHRDPELANEDIIGFLRKVYRDWLDGKMSRRQLQALDPSAEKAVQNYIYLNKRLPDGIHLLNRTEVVDRELQKIFVDPSSPRDAARLASAARRRQKAPKA